MDAAQVLRELWRRRRWVVVAAAFAVLVATFVAYRVSLTPIPSLESKSFEYGSAVTEVVLDAPFAPLVDVRGDLEPLAIRAQAYSRLMRSPEVLLAVADQLGIPPGNITALAAGAGVQEERSARLIAEEREFRLSTSSEEALPVVSVYVQAPSRDEAIDFADGIVAGFASYLEDQQVAREVPASARVQLRRLGPAQGGVVNEGADKTMVLLALVGAFFAGCFLIVVASGIANGWQALTRADQNGGPYAQAPLEEEPPLRAGEAPANGSSTTPAVQRSILRVPDRGRGG